MNKYAFSLLEIMIVLVIVGGIGYFLYPKMLTKPAEDMKTNMSQGIQLNNSVKSSIELQQKREKELLGQ